MKTIVLPSARADIVRQVGYFIDIGQEHVADRFLAAARAASSMYPRPRMQAHRGP